MGYVLRVRFASFFAGAAVASVAGMYFLHKDYQNTRHSITQQMTGLSKSLDERISSLEKFKEAESVQVEVPKHEEVTD